MHTADLPVGVFDSGLGGLSVLQTMVRVLPHEDFIYYGDTANAPYGTKDARVVQKLVERVADELLQRGIKALVIACNTATGAAAASLRKRLTIPVVGMEPALKPASLLRQNGLVLVLATPVTLQSEKYQALYARYGEGSVSLPCPGLMDFVERGELDSPALDAYLQALLAPYQNQPIDAAVLGCTHYAFLRAAIARHLPKDTIIINGNQGTARQLKRMLEQTDRLCAKQTDGQITFLSSGGEEALARMRALWTR